LTTSQKTTLFFPEDGQTQKNASRKFLFSQKQKKKHRIFLFVFVLVVFFWFCNWVLLNQQGKLIFERDFVKPLRKKGKFEPGQSKLNCTSLRTAHWVSNKTELHR
jgi:hypothetical protein